MTARPTVTGQLAFTVTGDPIPQGSKTLLAHRAVVESGAARLKPWRESIRAAAHQAMTPDWRPLDGPIAITLDFTLRSPKTRPRWRRYPDGRPDLDKLIRAVLDALTSIGAWCDDAQVVRIIATKNYPTDWEPPHLNVELHSIKDGDEQ